MSWDAYITNLTSPDQTGKPPIFLAAICGKSPQSVWASTPGFTVTEEQIRALCGNPSAFAQCGPTIGKYKCRFLRDNKEVEGLWCIDFKTTADAEGNAYNVCVGYANTALIIGFGTKEANGGQVSAQVFKITRYLRENGM